MFETPQNPVEALKIELSKLVEERGNLMRLVEESGENIDVELGSEGYIDHGYTARLREIEPRIEEIEKQLKDTDDMDAAQRNLNI